MGGHCGKNDLSVNGIFELLDVKLVKTLGKNNASGLCSNSCLKILGFCFARCKSSDPLASLVD